VHEVFFKIMTKEEARTSFSGDNLEAWVHTVARNHAIDFARRRKREVPTEVVGDERTGVGNPEKDALTRQLVAKFLARLPENLAQVFELRFVQQRSQRDAASELGMPRTTLAYHEDRIRALMDRFSAQVDP
jgi:RNA polymerase sigma-70 factor (ECF subfamily)